MGSSTRESKRKENTSDETLSFSLTREPVTIHLSTLRGLWRRVASQRLTGIAFITLLGQKSYE